MTSELLSLNTRLPLLSIGSSFEGYIAKVMQVPVLTIEEENHLSHRFLQNGDLKAAESLVIHHLRFVVHVARGYVNYGLPLCDLVQEGTVGLMKAVKRFNPLLGIRLATYAMKWIKAEINEFIIKNWRIVKMATTKAQRKLFFNLRSLKSHLGSMTQEEVNHVALALNVSVKDVREMEGRLQSYDMGFEATDDTEDEDYHAPAHYLGEEHNNPPLRLEHLAKEKNMQQLSTLVESLDERSQIILKERFLMENKATLQDLSVQLNISPERVRQLEIAALKKLRERFA